MNDNPRLPYGYEDNVTCTTDKTGRMAINWPEGCRGTVISRELLDAIVEEKNNCQRWIPVEERLPEEGVSVLVNHWMTGIEMAYRRGDQWGITWTGFMGSGSGYTHWMPLPEPPEVK